jgi:hypothetical protein
MLWCKEVELVCCLGSQFFASRDKSLPVWVFQSDCLAKTHLCGPVELSLCHSQLGSKLSRVLLPSNRFLDLARRNWSQLYGYTVISMPE